MPINSRQKGKRGELDLCHSLISVMGWSGTRRAQQFNGNAGHADVTIPQLPRVFPECKLVNRLNLSEAMKTAVAQCRGCIPVIFHRRDREDWMVTVRLSDWRALSEMVCAATPQVQSAPISQSDTTLSPPSDFSGSP
jgi:hypothetical protein